MLPLLGNFTLPAMVLNVEWKYLAWLTGISSPGNNMEVDLGIGAEGLPSILDIKPLHLCFTSTLPILIFQPVRIPERLTFLGDLFHFQLEVLCASFCYSQVRKLKN